MRGIGEALPIWGVLDGSPLHPRQTIFIIADTCLALLAPLLHHRNRDGKRDEHDGTDRGGQTPMTMSRARFAGQRDARHQNRNATSHQPSQPSP